MASLVDTLNNILIGKIAYDSDISEEQLRGLPVFWEMLESEDFTVSSTVEYLEELAYRGELRFNFEEAE